MAYTRLRRSVHRARTEPPGRLRVRRARRFLHSPDTLCRNAATTYRVGIASVVLAVACKHRFAFRLSAGDVGGQRVCRRPFLVQAGFVLLAHSQVPRQPLGEAKVVLPTRSSAASVSGIPAESVAAAGVFARAN